MTYQLRDLRVGICRQLPRKPTSAERADAEKHEFSPSASACFPIYLADRPARCGRCDRPWPPETPCHRTMGDVVAGPPVCWRIIVRSTYV